MRQVCPLSVFHRWGQRFNVGVGASGNFGHGQKRHATHSTTSHISTVSQNKLSTNQTHHTLSDSNSLSSISSPASSRSPSSSSSEVQGHHPSTFHDVSSYTVHSNEGSTSFPTKRVEDSSTLLKHSINNTAIKNGSFSSNENHDKQVIDNTNDNSSNPKHQSLPTDPNALKKDYNIPKGTPTSSSAFVPPTNGSYRETQGCDAWGPLCQTGSTVVSTRDGDTIATRTIACSSYLSAQAYTIRNDQSSLSSWRLHFGRSPQCTSYVQGEHASARPDWLSSCGQQAMTLSNIDIYPPGTREEGGLNGTVKCCGLCNIFVPRVNLRYFPQDPNDPCRPDEDAAASSMVTAGPTAARTSLFISGGFTYTSPSLYFEIMGTASFKDDCGHLGTNVISSTIAIPPGAMSTVSFDVPVGAILPRGTEARSLRHLAALKTRDLACPTWGVNAPVNSESSQIIRIAEPFYPLLVPPPQLIAVDDAWSKCVGNHWPLRFGIFDPPHALTANSVMVGSSHMVPTPEPELGSANEDTPSTAAPQLGPSPAAIPVPDGPKATSVGGQTPSSESSNIGSNDDESDADGSDNSFANGPSQVFSLGEPAHPAWSGGRVMTIGAATYTEGLECSCYSLGPDETLNPGESMTMGDGKVVSLAPNGASAEVDGATQQLLPVVAGVAPAFAGVPGIDQIAQAEAGGTVGSSPNGGTKDASAIAVQGLKGTETFSDNGCTVTAALVPGNSDLVVLGKGGLPLATLTPGDAAFTDTTGGVIRLDTNGLLNLEGQAVAHMTSSVASTTSRGLGAAVATAFHMATQKANPPDVAEASNAPTISGDQRGVPVTRGGQIKLSIPWIEMYIAIWSYIIFVLY